MDIYDFKTKTMIFTSKAPELAEEFIVGIDIGYSSCKIYSSHKIAVFPCYARRIVGEITVYANSESSIWYRDDETGTQWAVGDLAFDMISVRETNDSAASLCSRDRYDDEMFKVVLRTGLAIGMLDNNGNINTKGKRLSVQTGLPAAYSSDDEYLRDVFCGEHKFSVKIGAGGWQSVEFELAAKDVSVTSQPKGTFFSSLMDENGNFLPSAGSISTSKSLIFDSGFNTLDLITCQNGVINKECVSCNDMGMKTVFQETINEIKRLYNESFEVPYMQTVLGKGNGCIQKYDRKKHTTEQIYIGDILFAKSEEVCKRAIAKLRQTYNEMLDFNYLVITGGTGEAWWDIIKAEFAGLTTLTVVPGNGNTGLPLIFSNVRGYYFVKYRALQRLHQNVTLAKDN